MNNYNMKPFRFWCQKVLPLVYDDSLSYYEVLCKVVAYLNHIIEDINAIPDYIRSIISDEHLKDLLSVLLDELREQIASANEGLSETATADRSKGTLVWLNGKLYQATRDILAGDRYVESGEGVTGNIIKVTIEDVLDAVIESVLSNTSAIEALSEAVGALSELTTEDKDSVVDAINELVTSIANTNSNIGSLSDLTTVDKDSIVEAINELVTNISTNSSNIGDLSTLTTTDKSDLVSAINELVTSIASIVIEPSYFDMSLHGADLTGATACDSIIEEAIASGKTIYFPKGTYLITEQHVLQNVDVVGNQAKIHTTSFGLNQGEMNSYGGFNSEYAQMVFKLTGNVKFHGFIFDDVDAGGIVIWGNDCEVYDCQISTYATIAGSTGYYGIVVRECTNTSIHNVKIDMEDGNNRDGIHVEAGANNLFIHDCYIIAGDDGIALNSLEGLGGVIQNVFVNECYIGGYGFRFFGNGDTQVYHVEINNCTIEVTSPTMQSGCIRFSNTTNTIGGTPIGQDGLFNNINISNCNLIGGAQSNLSIYCCHAYVACRLTNCVLYNVVYYDVSTKDTHIHFSNCLLNEMINVINGTYFTSIELAECDIKGVSKLGTGTLVLTATDVNVSTALSITGSGADNVKFSNSLIVPQGVVLDSTGGTFTIKDTRVDASFAFVAGACNYFIDGLINHGGGTVITSGGTAKRISGDIKIDALPSTPVNGDHCFIGNLYKWYLAGQWLNVNMSA